jgi:hypothetical protein
MDVGGEGASIRLAGGEGASTRLAGGGELGKVVLVVERPISRVEYP